MFDDDTISRRNAIKTAGAAFAVGVGAVGSATAGPMECVATSTDAYAYDTCGGYAVTTVEKGRTGFVQDTCTASGVEYKKVDFDCTDTWWVKSSDLESASNCFC